MAIRQIQSRQSFGGNLAVLVTDARLVATGGTTGQVLAKNSSTNYDFGWTTPATGSGTPDVMVLMGAY